MPELAKRVTIDHKHKKLHIDGIEFPWLVDKSGPLFEEIPDDEDSIMRGVVTIPILVEDVVVIPECAECDRLDELEVEYDVVADGSGRHIRHLANAAAAREKVRQAEQALMIAQARLAEVGDQ